MGATTRWSSKQHTVGLATSQRHTKVLSTLDTPGVEGVSIVADSLYRTSRRLCWHVWQAYGANFPPAATESENDLAQPSQVTALRCSQLFWLAGDHLGRFDVTPSIRTRQITPKLQGSFDKLARTFPVLGCLARPNAKCAPYGIYCS